MSIVHIAHVCSHLQNASRARLGLTSIVATKFHVNLMLAFQKQGFLSSVVLGGQAPPLSFALEKPDTVPEEHTGSTVIQEQPWLAYPKTADNVRKQLLRKSNRDEQRGRPLDEQGLAQRINEERGSLKKEPTSFDPSGHSRLAPVPRIEGVPINPAQRRLWLGMKYWRSEPVLRKCNVISKPTKRLTASYQDLRKILDGWQRNTIKPIVNPGECIFVATDIGVLEIREAVERKRGGMVLCRVN